MSDPQRWAVVGGGVLGMWLAGRLAVEHEVTLIEAAPELGGLAASWHIGDIRWDRHYHVILPADRRTLALMAELGLSDDVTWRSVPAGCEHDGTIYPASTPREILRLPFLTRVEKARLGMTVARATVVREPRRLEDVSALDWLRRWSGRSATNRFWLPLLRSKLGSNADIASAAFIATTLKRLARARTDGGTSGDGFGFISSGYAAVLDRMDLLLEERGVSTRLGAQVIEVMRTSDGIAVTTMDGATSTYDRVVVTAASPLAAGVCHDLLDRERNACTSVTYQGIVCLSLLLARPLSPYYLTYLLTPQPFTAVIDMSALAGSDQLGGHGLVYLPSYVRSDDPLFDCADEDIVESFLCGLERLYPGVGTSVLSARVSKVRFVLPVPTLGYSTRLPPVRTSVPGLFLVSSALITDGTLNVDETLGVAERALARLLEGS